MYFKFGVDSFIWAENFSEKDLWVIEKAKELGFEVIDFAIANPFTFPLEAVKKEVERVGIECVCTTTLTLETNPISPDPAIRAKAVEAMKKCVDICNELKAPILGGVNYAGWGYLTKKPRTTEEWNWGVENMRQVARYAKETGEVTICVECVNRFETHFLNIAEDAVQFCKDVGTGNMKVHLDCFHMIREEKSFSQAVYTCGKEYLGYIHVNENDRGIPGTGLVPFREFFEAVAAVGYDGPLVIESFDPSFEELAGNCAIWRQFAKTGEELAVKGLANLKAIAASIPDGPMKIAIGCDEAAYQLKVVLMEHLKKRSDVTVTDFGADAGEVILYPDVAQKVAEAVKKGDYDRGILVCGTGIGMAISANKVPGIRAAVCHDPFSTERSRKSNNAQIMCMGERVVGSELAKYLVDLWLTCDFAGGGSAPKVERITEVEQSYFSKES